MTIGAVGDAGSNEIKGTTLGAKNQRTPAVLMLLMVLGAIEGFTNTKADHPPHRINAHH
jgi:hypothetical protein